EEPEHRPHVRAGHEVVRRRLVLPRREVGGEHEQGQPDAAEDREPGNHSAPSCRRPGWTRVPMKVSTTSPTATRTLAQSVCGTPKRYGSGSADITRGVNVRAESRMAAAQQRRQYKR